MARNLTTLSRVRESCLQGFWMPLIIGTCFISLGVVLQLSQQSQPQMSRAAKFGVLFCLFGTCCTVAALGWCLFDCSKKNILRRSTAAANAYFPFWMSNSSSVTTHQLRSGGDLILRQDTLNSNTNTLQQLFARRRSSPPPSYLQAISAKKLATIQPEVSRCTTAESGKQQQRAPHSIPSSTVWQQLCAADLQTTSSSQITPVVGLTSASNAIGLPGSAQPVEPEVERRESVGSYELPDYEQAIRYDSGDFVSIDLNADSCEPTTDHVQPKDQNETIKQQSSGGYVNVAFRRSSF